MTHHSTAMTDHAVPAGSASPPRAPAERLPTWLLASAAVLLVPLAGNRAGVALLAWIAPIPPALLAARLSGWRGRLGLLAVCVAGLALQTLKLATPPVTPVFALLYALPIASLGWLVLVAWDALRRRTSAAWGVHAYAALTVLADWVGFALSPFGAWAASATSHLDDLALLQVASLGGLGLVGLVVAWPIGAAVMLLLSRPGHRPWRSACAAASLLALAVGWGTVRLDALEGGETVRVGAVTVDFPEPLEGMEDLRGNVELLLARTALAARRGAQIVVWNEVATVVDPGEEAELVRRAAALARAEAVDLVAAYGVIVSRAPFRVDNVYRWIGPDGETLEVYGKHHLPPGEPSTRSVDPLSVHDRPWGRAAGAICYDYDFPALARRHARLGAGLVVVPSSDWRGIDPQHAKMARVRAIEGGMSVVRPVRAATSAAFDGYGRVRATLSAWEENERVFVATVPARQVRTVYAAAGDWPVALAGAVALGAAMAAARRRRAPRGDSGCA